MIATPYHPTRLLVAVHSYRDAEIAITWGSALAGALHLPITLVHVLDETRMRGDLAEAEVIAKDWVNLLSTNAELQNITVDATVLTGSTEEVLSRMGTENRGAILLFVASPGAQNGPAALGGGLDILIRAMRTPFMVIPEGSQVPGRVRRIVVGMDQSALAANVLNTARRLAHSLDVEIISVEAIEPDMLQASEFTQFEPVIRDDHVQIRGLASRVLLATAQARDASIIAVGSHGAGESRHALMGSTSEWLSQFSDRPVLIVPENRITSQD